MESPIVKRNRHIRPAPVASDQHDSIDLRAAQWKAATPDVDDPTFAVSARIQRISRYIDRALTRVAIRNGITRRDVSLLFALRRSSGPLTPTDLLAEIAITSGGIAKRIDQLEMLGYVARRSTSMEDARRVVIELTPKGRRLVDNELRAPAEPEFEVFRSVDPQARRALAASLRSLLLAFEAMEEGSAQPELAVEE